jgi:acetoin utilization protein AcuB
MLVRQRMSRKLVSVKSGEAVGRAAELMHKHRIRHLPVVDKRRLVGIVSDRDVRAARGGKAVAEVMSRNPVVVGPNAAIDEAARLMHRKRFDAVPVVERNRVMGLLTTSDVLDAFIDLSGVSEPTCRLAVTARPGTERAVKAIVDRCRAELKWMHRDGGRPARLHLRVKTRNVDDLVTALEAAGFDVTAVVSSRDLR